jgi:MFS family permease
MPSSGTNDGPAPPQAGRLRTFRALRHRNYRLYFIGQLVSLTGSWVQTTALMWLAFDRTNENRWPALVMALQIFPTCLLGVWGGSLAERWPRRSLILLTQSLLMVNAFLLAGLVLTNALSPWPWQLLVVAAVGGLISAVDLPARLAFTIDLVGRDDLINGVALNSLTFNLARALGPALGAALLAALGPGPCFLLNGLSYLAVLAALARMEFVRPSLPASNAPARESIGAAFRFLAGRPTLALLLVLVAVMVCCGWPTLSFLPALAQRRVEASEALLTLIAHGTGRSLLWSQLGYGLLLSGFGAGALLAALTVASFGSLARGRAFIGVSVAVTAIALVTLSWARSLPLALGSSVLVGYGLILFMSTSQGVVQLSAGDHNRGRIMGIWSMIISGAQPLGNLLLGPAADVLGEPAVLRLQGLGIVVGAALVAISVGLTGRRRADEVCNRTPAPLS